MGMWSQSPHRSQICGNTEQSLPPRSLLGFVMIATVNLVGLHLEINSRPSQAEHILDHHTTPSVQETYFAFTSSWENNLSVTTALRDKFKVVCGCLSKKRVIPLATGSLLCRCLLSETLAPKGSCFTLVSLWVFHFYIHMIYSKFNRTEPSKDAYLCMCFYCHLLSS